MHLSDVSLVCAQECSRLAVFCTDELLAKRLRSIALRLHRAALDDAELCEVSSGQDPLGKGNRVEQNNIPESLRFNRFDDAVRAAIART
jgi:hypothetical protein